MQTHSQLIAGGSGVVFSRVERKYFQPRSLLSGSRLIRLLFPSMPYLPLSCVNNWKSRLVRLGIEAKRSTSFFEPREVIFREEGLEVLIAVCMILVDPCELCLVEE